MKQFKQSNIHITAILLLASASGFCYTTEKVTYSGYAVFRTFPQRDQHIFNLRALRAQECEGVEFWTEPSTVNKTVDIMVSPEQQYYFTEHLRHWRLPAKRLMHDVGEVIRRTNNIQMRVGRMLGMGSGDNGHNVSFRYFSADNYYLKFQTYMLIERKLELLAASNPTVTLDVVGRSFEGRKLYLVKVSTDKSAQKPVIFLDAGHHAREWISHSTIMYILESLIEDDMPTVAKQDSGTKSLESYFDRSGANVTKSNFADKFRSLLDKYDFWFLPVVNPDGYEYTHTRDRLWRKTRSVNGNWCLGVDPNRNYPFHWGGKGTSRMSCDETYAGPKALSEPETRTLANIIMKNRGRVVMYISLHAYSQVILLPYGFDSVYPVDYDDMLRVAAAGSDGISSLRGTKYRFGTSAVLLYPAAGGSDDYAYENGGVKYSYTIELPDTGDRGFLLPPSQIIPVGQETVSGLTAMINAMNPNKSI